MEVRINLKEAQQIAISVQKVLAPLCLKDAQGVPFCRVAGSVRRLKPDGIHDVEFVMIPENKHLVEIKDIVNTMWGEPSSGAFPSRYTKIRSRYNLDLFWCSRENFAVNYFIRTGPQKYGMKGLAHWKKLTEGGYSEGAILHLANGKVYPTLTEEDVFNALQWNYVKPENRV